MSRSIHWGRAAGYMALAGATIWFLVVPPGASPIVVWLNLVTFYVTFVARSLWRAVEVLPSVKTFASTETLFYVFYYPLFYLPYQMYALGNFDLAKSGYVAYTFPMQSNRAILLATMGLLAFSLGASSPRRPRRDDSLRRGSLEPAKDSGEVSTEPGLLGFVVALLFVLLVVNEGLGLRASGEAAYTGPAVGGLGAEVVSLMLTLLSMIVAAIFFHRLRRGGRRRLMDWVALTMAAYWAVQLLIDGNRNAFLLVGLVGVAGLLTVRSLPSRTLLAVLGLTAFLGYSAVEVVRASGSASIGEILTLMFSPRAASDKETSFNITTITLRAALGSVPSTYPYGLGYFKLVGLAGILPFVRGLLLGTGSDVLSTADLLRLVLLQPNERWGVGSNVVADAYIDFGWPGVVVLLYALGKYSLYVRDRLHANPHSERLMVLYLVTLALVSEVPRYSIDFPVRFVVWTILLYGAFRLWNRSAGGIARASRAVRRSKNLR